MKLALLEELRAARAEGRAVALVTWLDGSASRIATVDDASELGDAVRTALRTDQATVVAGEIFIEPHNPPIRLVIIGAVHVAQPLAEMARLAGFTVTIVDPRRAWASPARFPGLALVTEWPDVALEQLKLDARTAVVALTHDPKLDDPGLAVALRSPAFYLGCLGSTKTHAARRARLAAAGFDDAALDRLHGPVGLPIHAKSPAEIAVAILAEIIATLRGAS